jgi:hypothetical protein
VAIEDAAVFILPGGERALITASGLGDVEFANEIVAELGALDDSDRAEWTHLFRSGKLPSGGARPALPFDAAETRPCRCRAGLRW